MFEIKKIIVSGDFLRPSRGISRPNQHLNTRWMHDLLRQQLMSATGLPVEMIAWAHDSVTASRLSHSAIDGIYASLDLPLTIDGWAALYDLPILPDAVEFFLHSLFKDSLAVFFELPPVIEKLLKRHGIPYIDATIHPLRFMDDIYLGMRGSCIELQAQLDAFRLPEAYVRLMAGIQKAAAGRLYRDNVPPDTMILLLQVRDDKTQIRDGRFVGASDFIDEILTLSRQHSRCLIKAHPLDRGNPHQRMLEATIPNMVQTDENYYRLLSLDNITTVASLSSSTCVEAPYFGKAETYFYRRPYALPFEGETARTDQYIGVYNDFLNTDFWRKVLSGICQVSAIDNIRVPEKANRLRISLREFWRYSEIDTDIIVDQYMRNSQGK